MPNNSHFCAIVTDCYAITADDLVNVMTIDDNAWKSCHRDMLFSPDVCLSSRKRVKRRKTARTWVIPCTYHLPCYVVNISLTTIDLSAQDCNTFVRFCDAITDPAVLHVDHIIWILSVISIQQSLVIAQPSVTIAQSTILSEKTKVCIKSFLKKRLDFWKSKTPLQKHVFHSRVNKPICTALLSTFCSTTQQLFSPHLHITGTLWSAKPCLESFTVTVYCL